MSETWKRPNSLSTEFSYKHEKRQNPLNTEIMTFVTDTQLLLYINHHHHYHNHHYQNCKYLFSHQGFTFPVACNVGEWMPWGDCSATCGGGTKKRAWEVIEEPFVSIFQKATVINDYLCIMCRPRT